MMMKLTVIFDVKEPAYRMLDKMGMISGVIEIKVDDIREKEDQKDVVWEAKATVKCPYCGDVIGGIGRGVKCKCGKTVLSGLLPEGFGLISGGRDINAK